MAKVEMYSKAYCPFCVRAKALLTQLQVDVVEYAIDQQPQLREQMITRANGGYTVPQIFINDQHIGGCDELMALHSRGELQPLLDA